MPRSPGDPLAEALEEVRAELRLEAARADAAERERDAASRGRLAVVELARGFLATLPRCEARRAPSECSELATYRCLDAAGDPVRTCDGHRFAGGMDGDEDPVRLYYADEAVKLTALVAVDAAQVCGDVEHVGGNVERDLKRERERADAAERERDALLAQNVGEGHGSPCYYCGDPCNALAGSPTRWPIPLCHADDPGRVKWHHVGCVSARLRGHDPTLAEVSAEADRYARLPAPVDDPLLSLARTRAAWLTLAGAAVAALRAMPDATAVTDDPPGGGGSSS